MVELILNSKFLSTSIGSWKNINQQRLRFDSLYFHHQHQLDCYGRTDPLTETLLVTNNSYLVACYELCKFCCLVLDVVLKSLVSTGLLVMQGIEIMSELAYRLHL